MKLTDKQVCDIGFAVLRAHNNDRLWRALTYSSGPYDVTMPALPLLDLGQAFYDAGAKTAPLLPEQFVSFALRDLKANRKSLDSFLALGNEVERARKYDEWIAALEAYCTQYAAQPERAPKGGEQ